MRNNYPIKFIHFTNATPGEDVMGSIPSVAAPYWLGRCHNIMLLAETGCVLSTLSHVWQHVKLSDISLGTHPRYSLVADEEAK